MTLLINVAAGGLGIQAIQIAKVLGALVTAIAGNSQTEFLQSYGADTVYDYNQISIHGISDTFDVILDLTNLLTLQYMKKLLTPNGIFIPAEPNLT
jgi:NADPH:quinone reductase-like Zn-dependent oxidoreductase